MHRILFLSLALGLFSQYQSSQADLLFERSLGVNRSVNILDTNQFDLDLTLANSFFNSSNPVTLFDDLIISTVDVGNTYSVSSGDSTFEDAELRITDSLDEHILVILAENQPCGLTEQRGWSESLFFSIPLH